MTPYYEDDFVTLFHARWEDVLFLIPNDSVSLVLTDPPYDARTHEQARSLKDGVDNKSIDFDAFTIEDQYRWLSSARRICPRWTVASMAIDHASTVIHKPPPGMLGVRMGIWRKVNGAPSFHGDRPGMGYEALAILHRELGDGKLAWNGGGKHGVWEHPVDMCEKCGVVERHPGVTCLDAMTAEIDRLRASALPDYYQQNVVRAKHKSPKPVALLRRLINDFCLDEDGLIVDFFAGECSTLVAAKELGLRAIGIEMDEKWCREGVRRLKQEMLPFAAGVPEKPKRAARAI